MDNMKTIEERKQTARNTNEVLDYFVRLIESNNDRFSFAYATGGETAVIGVYDKEKEIIYSVKIEPMGV